MANPRSPLYARGWIAAPLVLLAACGGSPKNAAQAPTTVVVPAASAATPDAGAAPLEVERVAAPEDDAAVAIATTDPFWGDRDAPVTIVFFGDYQCPFTGRAVPTIRALEEKYGPHQLRVVWKDNPLPFHPNARPAAEAAAAVYMLGRDEAFWKFHALAFANQAALGPSSYEEWASTAGVGVDAFKRLVADHAGAAKIDSDMALAKRLEANGTPTFYVNGLLFNGAQPEDKFVAAIDPELEKAKARKERGVAPDHLYLAAVQENYKPRPKEAAHPPADTTTVYAVPLGTAPTLGPATAKVKIVEFGDFQCPYTKRVEETLARLRAKYGDRLQLVWRDEPLPFHPLAPPAAELAREARIEKGLPGFWKVHDALFALPTLEEADLMTVAKSAGLDPTRAKVAIDKQPYKAGVQADQDLADDLQASGTPHFFINGRRLVGAQPIEKFSEIIDEELAHADRMIASGTAPALVYDAIVKAGKQPGAPQTRWVAPAKKAPSKGTPGAKVVIEEFADFECPFCKRAQDTLKEVLSDYAGKIELRWRDNPLPMHPHAEIAAEAAREAQRQQGSAAFFKMHDKLFAAQGTTGFDRAALSGYAHDLGLDVAAFDQALDGHRNQALVDADKQAAQDAELTGAPSFVVGGYLIIGAQPASKFRRIIDRVLLEGPAHPLPKPPAPAQARSAPPVTPNGTLQTTDLVVGQGRAAASGDTVTVHYVGTLVDGTEFDSSRKHGNPFTFHLGRGQVIKGWDQGVAGMRVGGRRRLVIPPDLGYGDHGAGPIIKPGATLVFDVELLSIQ